MGYSIEHLDGLVRVHLDGEEYRTCVRNADRMALGSKRGGSLNSSEDPKQSKRYGQLAEMAYARWRGLKYTIKVMRRGDAGIDFEEGGLTIDVKTSSRGRDHCLLKKTGDGGVVHRLADIFVCGRIIWEDQDAGEAVVEFIGWMTRSNVLATPIEPAAWHDEENDPKGNLNHRLDHTALRPLDGLDEMIGPPKHLPLPPPRQVIQEGPWAGIAI